MKTLASIEERLLSNSELRDNGCREWTGSLHRGYGGLGVDGKILSAHRLACELAHGPAPEGKPWALHHCDNPPCIEGSHLYWGDAFDNARDRSKRGRDHRGNLTQCKNGHEFNEQNTGTRGKTAGRRCRACHRERAKAYYHAGKRAAQ